MRKQIITIAGRPGSGKSTTAKLVAKNLGFDHFSSGELFRALAKERNIDLMTANLSSEENAEIDHLVDGRLRDMGAKGNNLVIDSRTAWHWMPLSFKVFLTLDFEVAAKRIISAIDKRKLSNEGIPQDPGEYASILKARLESENRRYKALYGIDPLDMSNYDLVIDTELNSPEEVVRTIIKYFRS